MSSHKQILSAVGPSIPVASLPSTIPPLPATILCLLSPSASLTYSLEVTADAVDLQTGIVPPDATWFPLGQGTTGLSSSSTTPLASKVTGIRANVTAYTSGTLTFDVAQ